MFQVFFFILCLTLADFKIICERELVRTKRPITCRQPILSSCGIVEVNYYLCYFNSDNFISRISLWDAKSIRLK